MEGVKIDAAKRTRVPIFEQKVLHKRPSFWTSHAQSEKDIYLTRDDSLIVLINPTQASKKARLLQAVAFPCSDKDPRQTWFVGKAGAHTLRRPLSTVTL